MNASLNCPSCGTINLDLHKFESMMVVTSSCALFTVCCPTCGAHVAGLRTIPEDMHDEVQFAAIEVGAGMGRK